MTLNKNKNVGNVLFIVEGDKSEFAILKHVFKHILNYSLITKNRHSDFEQYKSTVNSHSTVAIINTKYSNIKYAGESGNEYLDSLYERLINEFDFEIDNAWIFFLFDRDHHSNNNPTFIRNLISTLKNPLDNGENRAGELLLSYPGIEAYKLSCAKSDIHLVNDNLASDKKIVFCNQLKTLVNDKGLGNIQSFKDTHILHACSEFLKYLIYTNNSFSLETDLDDFSSKSLSIFNIQEDNLNSKKYNDFFSMLSLAFLQLGITEI